ncbi:MAG: adenylate kinase-like kinase [Anaerolineaceae bacterium]|nr:MAG: adenylate kinase-like kinase [Anaerolineaceae bacterium]
MTDFPHRRIVVVGATGSGKTTLAGRLAARLGVPHVELDALHWEPNWTHATDEEFRARADAAASAPAWVVDGNYSVCRDIVWSRAEAVVWLDYPFWTVFWRLWNRIWRRWWTRELLWGNNREPLWVHFKLWSDDSLIKWLFKTYWRRKRQYPALLASPEYSRLKVFHLKSQREADDWLEGIEPKA